jgi:hypothetical protein
MYKIKNSLLYTENVVNFINTAKYEDSLLFLFPVRHDVWCDFLGKLNEQKQDI